MKKQNLNISLAPSDFNKLTAGFANFFIPIVTDVYVAVFLSMLPKKANIFGINMGRKAVVFLGNVGFWQRTGWKSKKYAKLAPKIEFIGIDLKELEGVRPRNLRQIQKNFEDGLRRLQDNSVSLIRSDLAVGHYDAKGNQELASEEKMPLNEENPYFAHTHDILEIAYRKLESNGKFVATLLNDRALTIVIKALEETPFRKNKPIIKWVNRGKKLRPLPKIILTKTETIE